MAIDLKKFVLRFIDEGRGHLQTISEGAFLLSVDEHTDAWIGEMFRAAHTLKGGGADAEAAKYCRCHASS